jgi:hypothetical protein
VTLTCDTTPVTEPDPAFRRLRVLADELAAAEQRAKDIERERDAEIVRVTDAQPRSMTAAGRAARLSRQRVYGIVALARARREGNRPDPQS